MKKNRNNSTFLFLNSHHVTGIGIILIFLLLAVLGQGCAPSLVSIARNELERMKNQPSIHVVHYSSPSLTARTPSTDVGAALGGVLGAGVSTGMAKTEGEKLKEQCSLGDSSIKVRETVLDRLSAEMGIKNFRVVPDRLESDELDTLRSKFGNDLLMDFKTHHWTLYPVPGSRWTTSRYFIIYSIRARLVRLQDSKVIWLGYAKFDESQALSTSSTWDELIANDCTALKTKVGKVAEMCAQQLADQLFGRTVIEK
jgi:hypothetical protein